jgi:ABC-2 type transport system permease protein
VKVQVPRISASEVSETMSPLRVIAAYLAQAKCELLLSVRSPQLVVFTVLFPVMFYLLVGFIFGPFRHPEPRMRSYVLIGFIIMAVMTPGFSSFAGVLATDRETGLHALRRALPMPAGADLIAKAVVALLCVGIVVPVLMMLGEVLGNVELSFQQLASIGALALAGSLPFCALGFFIGMHASARAVPAVVNLLMIPMLYLSGALFPLPQSLGWLTPLTPPFYLQQLMLAAADAPHRFVGGPLTHAALLAGITTVFAGLALRRFRAVS